VITYDKVLFITTNGPSVGYAILVDANTTKTTHLNFSGTD